MTHKIQFFTETIKFYLGGKGTLRAWLSYVIKEEKRKPWYINFIFCNDDYLYELNKSYLGHDSLTDILTFQFSEDDENVSGDIYLSIDRIRENAVKFGEPFENELYRVMVHGVLHLVGYKDESKGEKEAMREKENFYLEKLCFQPRRPS